MSLAVLQFARSRVIAFLEEVSRLEDIEFPYNDSKDAVPAIRMIFETALRASEILLTRPNPVAISQYSVDTLRHLFEYHPLLGIIRRSANVRNSFEAFGPLLRLAGDLLEPKTPKTARRTRLILSSEWTYVPFTKYNIRHLKEFVIIGLPASESSNPLLLPLAGHELGHSVWLRHHLHVDFDLLIRSQIAKCLIAHWNDYINLFSLQHLRQSEVLTDLISQSIWGLSHNWAMSQAEETFCDYIGLKIFGPSYLKSFSYLLAPKAAGKRSVLYPNMKKRAENLETAAKSYGIDAPPDFVSIFEAEVEPKLPPTEAFRLAIAVEAVNGLNGELISRAESLVLGTPVVCPDPGVTDRIYTRLHQAVPAEDAKCLANILNAAWKAYEDPAFWDQSPELKERKRDNLFELILKNIEVFEIEQIPGNKP